MLYLATSNVKNFDNNRLVELEGEMNEAGFGRKGNLIGR